MRKLPEWLETAVFYEIYPQSFLDTNGDGIGDLNGIIEKLDYIRELGCNALWLNPCFDSPFGDAGYDVADYCRIAPRYGTNADAQRLFNEAHARGMHVILDLVPGHTSGRSTTRFLRAISGRTRCGILLRLRTSPAGCGEFATGTALAVSTSFPINRR